MQNRWTAMLGLLALFSAQASQADLYLSESGTGDDCEIQDPCNDLALAAQLAQSGDTIHLDDGDYIVRDVELAESVTIRAINPGYARLLRFFLNSRIIATSSAPAGASYVFEGLVFDGVGVAVEQHPSVATRVDIVGAQFQGFDPETSPAIRNDGVVFLRDSHFVGNEGQLVVNRESGRISISGVSFVGNEVAPNRHGGRMTAIVESNGALALEEVQFHRNRASAIVLSEKSQTVNPGTWLSIHDSVFHDNIAGDHSPAVLYAYSAVIQAPDAYSQLENVVVSGNECAPHSSALRTSNSDLQNVRIENNSACTGWINTGTTTARQLTVRANGSNGVVNRPHSDTAEHPHLTITGGIVSHHELHTGVVNVGEHATVVMDDVNIAHNTTNSCGGILNTGLMTAINSKISDNTSALNGGGICNQNELFLIDSEVARNTADSHGGGIFASAVLDYDGLEITTIKTTIVNSRIEDNVAGGAGGGVLFDHDDGKAYANVESSTIFGNSAKAGGGVRIGGDTYVAFANTTVTGNFADFGSAVSLGEQGYSPQLGLYNSTLAEETDTAAIRLIETYRLFLRNSILSNTAGTVCDQGASSRGSGPSSTGHNIFSDDSCVLRLAVNPPFDLVGADPALQPLGNNGGSTPTRALEPNSPAVDRGIPNGCTADLLDMVYSGSRPTFHNKRLLRDQRGFDRYTNGYCDIGAYEFGSQPAPDVPRD